MGAQNVRHLHGLSCLATAAAQGPQTARQELLCVYRTLRPGLPIGSDFVPWHKASIIGAAETVCCRGSCRPNQRGDLTSIDGHLGLRPFFVVASCVLAAPVPWWITRWRF